jgi:ParB family chromosome partitioning protein
MKKTEKAVAGEVRRIPLKEIVPSSNNPRKTFNADELNELAESIKENGLLQPITVRPVKPENGSDEFAKYEIVCGERRYRATQLTGAEEIDCIIKELDDKQALTAMIFENMQRKDVDPMEEANAIDRLVNEFGVDVQQVAKMLGKSETFVRSRLRLNTTIDEFVDLMQNGPLVLTHLLEISKLPQEQQKVLYETNFTPECIARWKYKFPNIPQLKEMIDADVMMKLDKAVFSLVDETFEDAEGVINPCAKCPLNTQNDPANAGDVTAPRCMKRSCFLCKTKQHIIREAKLQQSDGKEIVYAGSEQENAEIIAYAKEQGLELSPIGIRKTVIDPEEPKREDFTEEEFYEKRHQTWAHQKAIFDIGIKDGNIVPVYEVSFNGHLSGMTKFVYNVKDEDMGLNQESRQMRQEQAMKYKGQLSELTDKRHDEKIERYRKAVEEGDYSRLNTAMGATENDVLIALMLMHLSYDFKQSLGLEWTTDRDFLKNYKDKLQQNRNAIKREFIRQSLAEKSVNFAKGLQGILEIFVSDQFPQVKEVITKELDDKYAKQRDNLKKKIEDLKSDVKKLREAEQAKEEEPAKEQPETAEAPTAEAVPAEAPAAEPAEEQVEAPAEAPAEEAPATEEAAPAEEKPAEEAPAETPVKPKKEKKGKKGKK